MLAQHARRTRLKGAEKPTPLAEVVNGRLSQHGIDTEKISWDAYRRDDGTWRIIATWPSGKATAQAIWDMDKARQVVTPHDDMAQYLCAERPTPILGQEPAPERGGHALPGPSRGEPSRGGHGLPAASEHPRPGRDPIRAGRDALLASLDRPLGGSSGRGLEPRTPAALAGSDAPRQRPVGGGAARAARRWPGLGLRRRLGRAQGGAGRAVAGGAAAPPDGRCGSRRRRVHRRQRQAAQAAAELGRRPLRQRPGRPRVLLTLPR